MSKKKETKLRTAYEKDEIRKESVRTYQATTTPVPDVVKPSKPKNPSKE